MIKFNVKFKEEKCKGCGLCVKYCPVKIVELDNSKINAKGYTPATVFEKNMEKCIGCTNCAMMCPDLVIEVIKNNEVV